MTYWNLIVLFLFFLSFFSFFFSESSHSLPLTICRSMIIELVEDLPLSSLTPNRFAPLCSLLRDPSADVQTTSYRLLQRMIHAKTQDLVVQVEVSSSAAAEGDKEEEKVAIELPEELMELIAGVVEEQGPSKKEVSGPMQIVRREDDLYTASFYVTTV